MRPSYLKMSPALLNDRAEELIAGLRHCFVCPHQCDVDRIEDERGFCRGGAEIVVSDYGPHFGEERPLVASRGSGTIFLGYCNMRCVYCQNYDISCLGRGETVDSPELASIMLELQAMGCHNINFVSPSHWVPQIVAALALAVPKGLNIPLVYNSGGYDRVETLRMLEGIFDIYMPDIKYADEVTARKYSGVRNYPEIVKEAVKEMYRQVGDLQVDEHGLAIRGVIIRHLVLPADLAGTGEVMQFIARDLSPKAFVNIMDQYYPAHEAHKHPPLNRRISRKEFIQALEDAAEWEIRP